MSISYDERLCRLILDASPAGMIFATTGGTIVLTNRRVQEQLGYTADELLGQQLDSLLPTWPRPAHPARALPEADTAMTRPAAAAPVTECVVRRKDGASLPVDVSLHTIAAEPGPLLLAQIMDATDRRQADQEREARQAIERLATLGQLTGSVAHELRTPLSVIRNDAYYLSTLADQLGAEAMQCIDEINAAVGRADRIVTELLDFTRDPPSQQTPVPVDQVVTAALGGAAMPASVTLDRVPIDPGLQIHVDQEQIERVLVNLLCNAAQATGPGGHIAVAAGADARSVWIEIVDSGDGIDVQPLERIFEPLFTTKPTGVGLGLAISRRYAERNGGTLTAANRSAGGASFRLTLPRWQP